MLVWVEVLAPLVLQNLPQADPLLLWSEYHLDELSSLRADCALAWELELQRVDRLSIVTCIIRLMAEWQSSKEHLKEENPKTPDVNPLIIGYLVNNLVGVVARRTSLTVASALKLWLRSHSGSQTKVTKTDVKLVVLNKYVLWFDVAVHDLAAVNSLEGVDQLNEDLARIVLREMASWLDFHEVPEICEGVEGQDNSYVLVVIDDDVFNLTNAWDTNELVHYHHFILDVSKQVLLPDLLHAHVLQALHQALFV